MSSQRGQKKPAEQSKKQPTPAKKRENRVRIRLTAYDHRVLDISTEKIIEVLKNDQGKLVGPVPLPTKIRRFCVLRSPHVDKKSREHFEMRIHRRLIDIIDPGQEFAAQLSRLDLPAGVDIEVKL
jgi:small subunit ribosomal protein S10